jgi:hypothetical protein
MYSEKEKEYNKKYYANRKKEMQKKARDYYKSHADERKEYSCTYRRLHKDKIKKWNNDNKTKVNRWRKDHYKKIRLEVLQAYGGKCACCGEAEPAFLAIDHVNGNGNKHRKETKLRGLKMFFWLRRNGYPSEFQLLCHNCNVAKGSNGICPHQVTKV